jgi:hypothetical protein
MKKKVTRSRKPPPSPNEAKLEMLTSRASNAYAQIHQEMARAMGLFKRGIAGRKGAKTPAMMVEEAKRAVERAVRLTDALKRDLMVLPVIMNAITTEAAGAVPPPPVPGAEMGPRLLEV